MDTSLILQMAAEAAPERMILGTGAQGICFAEMIARARAGAAWLRRQHAERVVFIGLNGPTLPIALFASGFLRAPFVPLNYRLTDEDLNKLLERTAPCTAIVDDDMLHRVKGGGEGVTLIARSAFDAQTRDTSLQEASDENGEPDILKLSALGRGHFREMSQKNP